MGFEIFNLHAERRLRHVAEFGRLPEMERFRQRGEVTKLLQRQIQVKRFPPDDQIKTSKTLVLEDVDIFAIIKNSYGILKKNRLALMIDTPHAGCGAERHNKGNGSLTMQWTTPKVVEIACGCEINAYFPADL